MPLLQKKTAIGCLDQHLTIRSYKTMMYHWYHYFCSKITKVSISQLWLVASCSNCTNRRRDLVLRGRKYQNLVLGYLGDIALDSTKIPFFANLMSSLSKSAAKINPLVDSKWSTNSQNVAKIVRLRLFLDNHCSKPLAVFCVSNVTLYINRKYANEAW